VELEDGGPDAVIVQSLERLEHPRDGFRLEVKEANRSFAAPAREGHVGGGGELVELRWELELFAHLLERGRFVVEVELESLDADGDVAVDMRGHHAGERMCELLRLRTLRRRCSRDSVPSRGVAAVAAASRLTAIQTVRRLASDALFTLALATMLAALLAELSRLCLHRLCGARLGVSADAVVGISRFRLHRLGGARLSVSADAVVGISSLSLHRLRGVRLGAVLFFIAARRDSLTESHPELLLLRPQQHVGEELVGRLLRHDDDAVLLAPLTEDRRPRSTRSLRSDLRLRQDLCAPVDEVEDARHSSRLKSLHVVERPVALRQLHDVPPEILRRLLRVEKLAQGVLGEIAHTDERASDVERDALHRDVAENEVHLDAGVILLHHRIGVGVGSILTTLEAQ